MILGHNSSYFVIKRLYLQHINKFVVKTRTKNKHEKDTYNSYNWLYVHEFICTIHTS